VLLFQGYTAQRKVSTKVGEVHILQKFPRADVLEYFVNFLQKTAEPSALLDELNSNGVTFEEILNTFKNKQTAGPFYFIQKEKFVRKVLQIAPSGDDFKNNYPFLMSFTSPYESMYLKSYITSGLGSERTPNETIITHVLGNLKVEDLQTILDENLIPKLSERNKLVTFRKSLYLELSETQLGQVIQQTKVSEKDIKDSLIALNNLVNPRNLATILPSIITATDDPLIDFIMKINNQEIAQTYLFNKYPQITFKQDYSPSARYAYLAATGSFLDFDKISYDRKMEFLQLFAGYNQKLFVKHYTNFKFENFQDLQTINSLTDSKYLLLNDDAIRSLDDSEYGLIINAAMRSHYFSREKLEEFVMRHLTPENFWITTIYSEGVFANKLSDIYDAYSSEQKMIVVNSFFSVQSYANWVNEKLFNKMILEAINKSMDEKLIRSYERMNGYTQFRIAEYLMDQNKFHLINSKSSNSLLSLSEAYQNKKFFKKLIQFYESHPVPKLEKEYLFTQVKLSMTQTIWNAYECRVFVEKHLCDNGDFDNYVSEMSFGYYKRSFRRTKREICK